MDSGFGSQIKSFGKNSLAVSLSVHVIGIDPHIIASIIGNPMPSCFDGRSKYFVELYNYFPTGLNSIFN